jgi:UDP-3-O-[3-hydroxymyristoyl] N-acetylglucosamine deacetylase
MDAALVVVSADESEEQRTLADVVNLTGTGTFTGLPCEMRLHPAPADTGIVVVTDGTEIPCTFEYLMREEAHTTSIGKDGLVVRSLEHLLSTLYFYHIDNCLIETLVGNEVPNSTGGSAFEYSEAIAAAGYRKLGQPVREWRIVRPDAFSWFDSTITVEPLLEGEVGLSVDVTIQFPLPIGIQRAQWCTPEESGSGDPSKFARARSFLRRDLDYVWPDGRNHWTTLHDSIRGLPERLEDLKQVAYKAGEWFVPPTFPDEPAWHKLMDSLGDFSLIGGRLQGRLKIFRPGHAFNHRALQWLLGTYDPEMPITARLD